MEFEFETKVLLRFLPYLQTLFRELVESLLELLLTMQNSQKEMMPLKGSDVKRI